MKAQIYYNTRERCYSVKMYDPEIGKVRVMQKGHNFRLLNAYFKVNASGIARIRRKGRKEVVATVVGELVEPVEDVKGIRVQFNPYHMWSFQTEIGSPITESPVVHFTKEGVWAE